MKKVLIYGLSNKMGGIETFIYNLISHIDLSKFDISILKLVDEELCFEKELRQIGCQFYQITSRRTNPIENRLQLKSLFRNHKFDVFHCNLNSLSYIEPLIQAKNNGVFCIVHSHNSEFIGRTYTRILHNINRYFLPKNNVKYIACSQEAGKWMFHNRNYTVIYNGVDCDKFKFSELKRKKIRDGLNLTNNETIILHIGAFRLQKNHFYLINIFKEYHSKNKNSKLFLLGDGELKESIMQYVKKNGLDNSVFFFGNRKDVDYFLSASDYFVFPSIYEGFPIALIEAESSGLKCFVSDKISTSAINRELCLTLDIGDSPDVWADSINRCKINEHRDKGSIYIKNQGYDLVTEVNKIEQYYLNEQENK